MTRWPLALSLVALISCTEEPPPEPPQEAPTRSEDTSDAQWGARLVERNGCLACHGAFAGSLNGIWGESRTDPDGAAIEVRGEVGRAYVSGWIRDPSRYQAGDSETPMPSFTLSDEDMAAIVEFVRCGDVPECPDETP